MASTLTAYRVFIASPSGLEKERKAFRDALLRYNEADAVSRKVVFIPVGWEDTLGGPGRPQSRINEDVKASDYFLLILCDRWGSPPGSEGPRKYRSGTEEEYEVAWRAYRTRAMPMRQLVVFFKAPAPARLSGPDTQLRGVLQFRKRLEREKKLLYENFDALDHFSERLRRHLAQWVRDHEGGNGSKVVKPEPIPGSPVSPPRRASGGLLSDLEPAVRSGLSRAWRLADDGKLTEAEVGFARALTLHRSPGTLRAYGDFLRRVGRLSQARVMYESILREERKPNERRWRARALNCLGVIAQIRGDLPRARGLHRKALSLSRAHALQEETAIGLANLGVIEMVGQRLDRATQMLEESLAINLSLNRKEGIAANFNSLGLICKRRGDLARALEFQTKSLEIHRSLRHREGMASNYGNLGTIHFKRGDLRRAEEMVKKALSIEQKLGLLEGMAESAFNLGVLYQRRGSVRRAHAHYEQARELYARLGSAPEIASAVKALKGLRRRRGRRPGGRTVQRGQGRHL